MKTITISTENSETYSSISNFFIDYYMTDANGEFVKVYLYLIRLLNSKQQISVAEIADHFNLTEKAKNGNISAQNKIMKGFIHKDRKSVV